jgi:hypothetical protein
VPGIDQHLGGIPELPANLGSVMIPSGVRTAKASARNAPPTEFNR